MKNITRFDLGAIIAFVVIGILGFVGWYYFSGELQDAQTLASGAKADFDKYSTKSNIIVSNGNGKVLQSDIVALSTGLNPLIQSTLQPKDARLNSTDHEDPVAWKHDLDNDVHALLASAKAHGVTLPQNFYFGFSRYLNQNPNDEQTQVLTRQLIALNEISNLLIDTPVKAISAMRRTYEEDPHSAGDTGASTGTELDHLGGYALSAPGNVYISYPFEVEFETTAENLRGILTNLVKSPDIFVLRTITVENAMTKSPQIADLDRMAAATGASDPNAVVAAPKGPQFLFGNSTLKVRARIDMIDWIAPPIEAAAPDPSGKSTVGAGSS